MTTDWRARLRDLGVRRPKRAERPPVSKRPSSRVSGLAGEERATRHLVDQGLTIVARNARFEDAELDVVASDGDVLVFVEVKMRRGDARGTGAEAVTPLKRSRVVRAARRWLAENPSASRREVRFDVVSVDGLSGPIEWIRGAFDATS